MTTIIVTTTADSSDGNVTPGGGVISLRDAIIYSENNPNTTIDIPAGTYTLSSDLPLISQSTTFVGAGMASTIINGNSKFRGFLISGIAANGQDVAATTVNISNIAFQNTVATGGDGTSGGGGGLGAGGAIFVGPAASVALTNVGFSGDKAVGGAAIAPAAFGGSGGGGGLGGAGGNAGLGFGGGGGGLFNGGGSGGSTVGGGGGGGGITSGGGTGADASSTGGAGGAGLAAGGSTLGGGGGGSEGGAKGGTGPLAGAGGFGGNGGFGGGGGGSGQYAGNGGFGGGGGGNSGPSGGNFGQSGIGGDGGFGGGGGGSAQAAGGTGGFGGGGGGGSGSATGGFAGGVGGGAGDGGGGGALGGAVFVAAGGTLTINGTTTETGALATGGASAGGMAGAGTGYGAGIFYEGGTAADPAMLTFGGSGAQSIANSITDLDGASGDTNTNNGVGGTGGVVALAMTGTGTLTLSGTNAYTGGTTISAGTLEVAADANLGATSGGLTIAGGTLDMTEGFASARTVALGAANGTVEVDTGMSTLSGVVSGVGSLIKTGAGTLTLTGANGYSGGTFVDDGTLAVASDGNLGGGLILSNGTLETTATFTSARTVSLSGTGTVKVDSGVTTTLTGTVSSDALLKTGTGTLVLGKAGNTYSGTTIDAGTLELSQSGAAGTNAITFAGTQTAPATLTLERAAQPTAGGTFNTLTNFGANDELDLEGFTYSAADTATLVGSTLTFTDNSTDAYAGQTESFTLGGTAGTAYAVRQNAGATGVLIGEVVCFAGGTRVRVVREGGETDVAVEDLVVGDLAITASGEPRPITWLGRREIDCATARVPSEVWPVRIRAGAFGAGLPERELRLSPGHPVLVGSGANEHLVPIMCLINGTSIERLAVPSVTYWHVELDGHDILLAEGLPAESFLDFGNRPWFGPDSDAHALANPDFVVPGLGARCRPVAIDGPVVAAERQRLDALFATRLVAPCAWPDRDMVLFA